MDNITIKRGDTYPIGFKMTSENLTCLFTTAGFTVAPAVGDIYYLNSAIFIVLKINGNELTAVSDSTTAPTATGTLTRSTGIGDATIAYTAVTTTDVLDITNVEFFFALKDKPKSQILPDDSEAAFKTQWSNHIDPVNGYTTLVLNPEDTDIPLKKYTAEVQLKAGDNIFSSQEFYITIVRDLNIRTS